MSTINSDEIISILKEEIQNYDEISKDKEVGQVVSVGDGIATIYGIDHAAYGGTGYPPEQHRLYSFRR